MYTGFSRFVVSFCVRSKLMNMSKATNLMKNGAASSFLKSLTNGRGSWMWVQVKN